MKSSSDRKGTGKRPTLGRPGERHSRGFTLIEMVLVMIIIGISVGLILPRVGAGWKRMEDREFLQEFVHTLKRARLSAMNSGNIVVFRMSGADRTYGIEQPPEQPIPDHVDIYADHLETDPETNDHVILFYPDGSMSGSDLEITFNRSRVFRIAIHPLFGTVQVAQVESP